MTVVTHPWWLVSTWFKVSEFCKIWPGTHCEKFFFFPFLFTFHESSSKDLVHFTTLCKKSNHTHTPAVMYWCATILCTGCPRQLGLLQQITIGWWLKQETFLSPQFSSLRNPRARCRPIGCLYGPSFWFADRAFLTLTHPHRSPGRERAGAETHHALRSLLTRALITSQSSTLMTSPELNYLPKTPPLKSIVLGVRAWTQAKEMLLSFDNIFKTSLMILWSVCFLSELVLF